MPYALYVCLQDDDKIAAFAMDAETGQLTRRTEVAAAGGPSVMASSPDRRTLYIANLANHRSLRLFSGALPVTGCFA